MIEEKPLTPINHGQILIVGGKTSNFDSDILDNPRVLLWDSQNENWHSKEIPSNTVAIFMTRFIGHNTFDKIVKEARKKRITIFNPLGTGIINKKLRELLGTEKKMEIVMKPETNEKIVPVKKLSKRIKEVLIEFPSIEVIEASSILKIEGYYNRYSEDTIKNRFYNIRKRITEKKSIIKGDQSDIVKVFDDAIAGLQLIREQVIKLSELQEKLKEFIK